MANNQPDTPTPTPTPDPTPGKGPPVWHHIEPNFLQVGPDAMQTAKTASWIGQPTETIVRHLRALMVMSFQAATGSNEPRQLGVLHGDFYPDAEHNAAGAAVTRTILLLAPPGPAVVSKSLVTFGGSKAIAMEPQTGALPAVAVVIIVVAVAAAAAYIADRTAEVVDSTNFRNNRTQQLLTSQARAIEVMSKHAEREKAAGKPLPFDAEERQLLGLLEDTQREIAAERKQPLPSPFDGARTFTNELSNLGKSAKGVLESLLPLALVGGALYLFSRSGSENDPSPRAPRQEEPRSKPEVITLTQNKDGVYVHDQ